MPNPNKICRIVVLNDCVCREDTGEPITGPYHAARDSSGECWLMDGPTESVGVQPSDQGN